MQYDDGLRKVEAGDDYMVVDPQDEDEKEAKPKKNLIPAAKLCKEPPKRTKNKKCREKVRVCEIKLSVGIY